MPAAVHIGVEFRANTGSIVQSAAMASHIKGACLCEGVQFEVHGDPESVFICYCAHCSKNAGAPGQIVRWPCAML